MIRCLYSAVILILFKEQHFIRIIFCYYYCSSFEDGSSELFIVIIIIVLSRTGPVPPTEDTVNDSTEGHVHT